MATLGNAYKMSAAISASLLNSSGAIYVVPAASFAIVEFYTNVAGTLEVAGLTIATLTANSQLTSIYLGPGQTLGWAAGGAGRGTVTGVLFANA